MNTAGLLHHFPSKDQVLVAALAERDRLDGARYQLRGMQGLATLDRRRPSRPAVRALNDTPAQVSGLTSGSGT